MQKLYYQFPEHGLAIACHLDMEINSIYIIREIPENRDHLENHLAGIWQQLLILYITKIKVWQFREEQMKSRISLSLQEVFSRQKDSIIFSIQVITVIIRHLEKPSQVLMHAYSDDLVTWHKTQDALTFTPQEGYDPDDWRDPWVIRDEENDQYLLILGARLQGPKTRQTGRTVKFTSKDLKNWKFEGDFWAPDLYTMHEMPDLFKIGDWWYHIVTEYSDRSKMVYRMSKSLEGPWIAPKDDAFDGRSYYAGRTFELNGQRILFGWVATKDQDDDDNNFIWAGTFMAHEVYQREDGTLGVRIPETVWNAFDKEEKTEDFVIDTPTKSTEKVVAKDTGDIFKFEADVEFTEGTRTFGVRFYEDEDKAESYQFVFNVTEDRYVFEKKPNWPWPANQNIGLERPLELVPGKKYNIKMIVDDTIATIYVDGVALNARAYKRPGESLSLFASEGSLKVTNCKVTTGLKK